MTPTCFTISLSHKAGDLYRLSCRLDETPEEVIELSLVENEEVDLTQRVFIGKVREKWAVALERRERTGWLRVLLHLPLNEDSWLHHLPWEQMYDPFTERVPLARTKHTSFARTPHSTLLECKPVQFSANPKALIVIARPTDVKAKEDQRDIGYNLDDFSVDEQKKLASKHLYGLDVKWLVSSDSASITEELLLNEVRNDYSILYFVCHGLLQSGEPYLMLQNDTNGKASRFDCKKLLKRIGELHGQQPLLVVLISCESSGSDHPEPFYKALAPRLLNGGVGAVVAYRGVLWLDAAQRFAEGFLREFHKSGDVDCAVTEGRAALNKSEDEWWRFLYFSRLSNSLIWERPQSVARESLEIIGAPPKQPQHFVETKQITIILNRILEAEFKTHPRIAITGMGGIGKTTLAAELARRLKADPRAQKRFKKIIWTQLWQNVSPDNALDQIPLQIDTPDKRWIMKQQEYKNELKGQSCVLIVDDVWDDVLDAIDVIDPETDSCIVFTAREARSAEHRVAVEVLDNKLAEQLWDETGGPKVATYPEARDILTRCDGLLIAIVMAASGLKANDNNLQFIRDYLRRIKSNPSGIKVPVSSYQYKNLAAVIEASFDILFGEAQKAFLELAVVRDFVQIPRELFEHLWGEEAFALQEALEGANFIRYVDENKEIVAIHSVVAAFCKERSKLDKGTLRKVHERLLKSYQNASNDWSILPLGDKYVWDQLGYHLGEAGRADEYIVTLQNLQFLAAFIVARGTAQVERELAKVADESSAVKLPQRLQQVIGRSAVLLNRIVRETGRRPETIEAVVATLHALIFGVEALSGVAAGFSNPQSVTTRLVPLITLPDVPHPNLLRTVEAQEPDEELIGGSINHTGTEAIVVTKMSDNDNRSLRIKSLAVEDGSDINALTVTILQIDFLSIASTHKTLLIVTGKNVQGFYLNPPEYQMFALEKPAPLSLGVIKNCVLSADGEVVAIAVSYNKGGLIKCSLNVLRKSNQQWILQWERPLPGEQIYAVSLSADGSIVLVMVGNDTFKTIYAFDQDGHEKLKRDQEEENFRTTAVSACGEHIIIALAYKSQEQLIGLSLSTKEEQQLISSADQEGIQGKILACIAERDLAWYFALTDKGYVYIKGEEKQGLLKVHAPPASALLGNGPLSFSSEAGRMAVTAYNMQSSENGSDSIERTEFSIFDLSGDVSPHLPYGRAISCSVGKGNWLAVGFDHIEETMVSDQSISEDSNSEFLCLWRSDQEELLPSPEDRLFTGKAVRDGAMSSDGLFLVAITADNVLVWGSSKDPDDQDQEFRDWAAIELIKPTRCAIAKRQNETVEVAVADEANTIYLYTLGAPFELTSLIRAQEPGEIRDLVCTNDDSAGLLIGLATGNIAVWQMVADQLERTSEWKAPENAGAISRIVCDETYALTAHVSIGKENGLLCLWRISDGKALRTFKGHHGSVISCAISPDGKRLLSVGQDQSVRVWDLASGKSLATLYMSSQLQDCAWFPDSKRIVVVGNQGVAFFRYLDGTAALAAE